MQEPLVEYAIDEEPPEGFGFVYCIETPKGERYVGKTRRSVLVRWRRHISGRNRGSDRPLLRAILTYGAGAMKVQVLSLHPLATLTEAENEAIVRLGTISPHGMNLIRGGSGPGTCSPETRGRISAAGRGRKFSDEHRRRIGAARAGRKMSAECRRRLSEKAKIRHALLGQAYNIRQYNLGRKRTAEERAATSLRFKGRHLTKEHRAKISDALRGKPKNPEAGRKASATKLSKSPRTHCSKGHLMSPDNVCGRPRGNHRNRRCRICWNEYRRNKARKARNAVKADTLVGALEKTMN